MNLRIVRALVFDFDGLILDTEAPEFQAWQETYAEHDQELDFSVWSQHVGKDSDAFDPHENLERMLGRPLNRTAIADRRRRRNRELLLRQKVLPGIVEYLSIGKERGLKMAVASSAPKSWVVPHLDRLGLLSSFHEIVTRDDVNEGKPSPEVYELSIKKLGVTNSEAIAFEDSPNGVLAAKGAGLFCVAIPNVITTQLRFDKADLVLPSLLDLSLNDLIAKVEAGSGN
jgi:HAD superfamily hydrolase (TIGR01509 family)